MAPHLLNAVPPRQFLQISYQSSSDPTHAAFWLNDDLVDVDEASWLKEWKGFVRKPSGGVRIGKSTNLKSS